MGTSILDLDLVRATGVKPQTSLGIDICGLWAALPLRGQDAGSLQPADLLRSSTEETAFSYIAYSAAVLKIHEGSGTAINKDGQK